jgi:uncharacterized protein YdeI (YjbR/CyaY-like superfamily)
VRKSFDEKSYLQRYTPRGRKSLWSQVNVNNVVRLIAEGRMTAHGLREVEAAKADGRWDRAYGAGKATAIPADLQAAIEASPKAKAMMGKLTEQNRFALAFRTHNMKTSAGRKKKIEAFVAMLERARRSIRRRASRAPSPASVRRMRGDGGASPKVASAPHSAFVASAVGRLPKVRFGAPC